jgi:hypothetical protein
MIVYLFISYLFGDLAGLHLIMRYMFDTGLGTHCVVNQLPGSERNLPLLIPKCAHFSHFR